MRTFFSILAVTALSGLATAGSIDIGTSSTQVGFNAGVISLGDCSNEVSCIISGSGTLVSTNLTWTLTTPISVDVDDSGSFSPFTITEDGLTAFSLTDDKKTPDTLAGNIVFSAATQSEGGTDLQGVITFTSVNLVNHGVIDFIHNNFGSLPSVGSMANFDLTVSCDTNCIQLLDPNGLVTSAVFSPGAVGAAPEPGTLALLGGGLAALLYRRRRS